MGNNYLNSGESIILTTHSISVDGGLYDILLTNERIVLVDNRYTRFEPLSTPFTRIISVKGGRVPTGEPAITLVLTESGSLADSQDHHLIFTQQPGEERRHERDLWVKRLIELVISNRQQEVGEATVPKTQEPGVKPSVRRWEAPDHLRPRTSPEKEPAPAKIVVEPDETELPEFLFEESVPASEIPEEEQVELQPVETPGEDAEYRDHEENREDEPAPPAPVPFPVLIRSYYTEEIPPEESQVDISRDQERFPAYTGEADESDDILAAEENDPPVQPEPFSSTVFAAITAMTSVKDRKVPAESCDNTEVDDTVPVIEEPVPVPVTLPPADEPGEVTPAPEIMDAGHATAGIHEEVPPAGHDEAETAAPAAVPIPSEVPAVPPVTISADDGLPVGAKPERKTHTPEPEPPLPPQEISPARRALPAATLAVLAILILVVGVVLIALLLPATPVSHADAVVTPSITLSPTSAPVLKNTPEVGVRIRVISPGTYAGTIGNPGALHQVSGSGNRSYTVLKNDDLVSATIQKLDNNGSPLTVEIYNNGLLLATRTVTAPQGEIELLIDPITASPPGITPIASRPANATGNATLIYY
jgi:hypothetical protein